MRSPFLLALVLTACATPNTADDRAAIAKLAERFASGFVAGNADTVVSLVTDDFIAMTPDEPAIVGRSAVHAAIVDDLRHMAIEELEFEIEELAIAGEWAFARGRSRSVIRAGESTAIASGKFLWILRRTESGWRLARDSSSGSAVPKVVEDRQPSR